MIVYTCFRYWPFFFLIGNSNLLKSAKGRNPYTREVYKRALKRVEQKVNLRDSGHLFWDIYKREDLHVIWIEGQGW